MTCFKVGEFWRRHSLAGQFGRNAFQFCQQLPDRQQLLEAHFGDNHAPARQTADQTLRLKFDQRLSDRGLR